MLKFIQKFKYFFLFLFLGFLLYGQTIQYDFSDLDDTILLKEDHQFIEDLSSIKKAFSQTVFYMRPDAHDIYYRPVLVLSFILDGQAEGNSPHIYHFSNILYHCIATYLLFLFLTRLGSRNIVSLIISLLFLFHPTFATSVAWIPGRNDTLLAIFLLASLIKLTDYLHLPSLKNLILTLLFFCLCLFTKETAMILLFLILIFLAIAPKTSDLVRSLTSKLFLLMAGYLLCIAAYYIARAHATEQNTSIGISEFGSLFKQYSPALLQYTGKLIFPFNLSTYPIMQDTTLLFGIAAIFAIYFLFRKRITNTAYFWFGFTWFILFLLPTSLIAENALEHRLYIPAMGFCIMLTNHKTINSIDIKSGFPRWVLCATILLFGILTFLHSKNFKDAGSFWKNASETSPNSATARWHMGIYYHDNHNVTLAEKEYRMAIRLNPRMKNTHNNLGKLLLDQGRVEEAVILLKKELENSPKDATTYYNLFSASEKQGKYNEAKQYLKTTIEIDPDHVDALNDLGAMLAMEKKYDDALELFHKVVQLNPTYKLAHKNIVLIYMAKKDLSKAREYYSKSKRMGMDISIPSLDSSN